MNEFHFRRSYRDVMNECRETNINNTHKRLNWAEPETSFGVPTQGNTLTEVHETWRHVRRDYITLTLEAS